LISSAHNLSRRRALLAALAAAIAGCSRPPAGGAPNEIVFRHPKLFGDPAPLDAIVAVFERETGLRVRRETLPASSDEQHLFYAINLQARSSEFDVLALDVAWTAEFAQAGWLRDVTHLVGATDRADLFPGPLDAAFWDGRAHSLPWFADAGLLYCRSDLLEQAGLAPPSTWSELVTAAREIAARAPGTHGFVWQGKQYEGLVCNALEFIWSHGGDVLGHSGGDGAGAEQGLAFMRELVSSGVSPAHVTTLTEEPSRVIFAQGRAVFLRNWPYAWRLLERPGSPLQGRVGVSALPSATGQARAATLGGWMLGVNAASTRAEAAERLIAHLASAPAHKALALAYGYSPPRRSLYRDGELAAGQSFLVSLAEVFEHARPRPVSPRYVALSQVMQSEFSAVLTGRRVPAVALAAVHRAAAEMERR
jgi:multiple sugar transport system substrate-binding protein